MKIAKITLALGALSLFSLSAGAQENARLSSVKQFADVVLDKAGDRYGHHSEPRRRRYRISDHR